MRDQGAKNQHACKLTLQRLSASA